MNAKINVDGGKLDVSARDGEIVFIAAVEGFPVSFSLVMTVEQAMELKKRISIAISDAGAP